MSDRISESERAAIALYLAKGGTIMRCPDGAAIGADATNITTFSEYLAEIGLTVMPIRADLAKHLRHIDHQTTSTIDTIFRNAA